MINVRINPDAPTKLPATIKTLFPIMKPVKAAAIPDRELSRETTTGISAPPIGNTIVIPRINDMIIINHIYNSLVWLLICRPIRTMTAKNKNPLMGFSHDGPQVGVLYHFPKISTPPFSLYIAKIEPLSVIHPTNADNPAAV